MAEWIAVDKGFDGRVGWSILLLMLALIAAAKRRRLSVCKHNKGDTLKGRVLNRIDLLFESTLL